MNVGIICRSHKFSNITSIFCGNHTVYECQFVVHNCKSPQIWFKNEALSFKNYTITLRRTNKYEVMDMQHIITLYTQYKTINTLIHMYGHINGM